MTFANTYEFLERQRGKKKKKIPSTLILELPHRELGGKITPYADILQLRDYCHQHNIRFHMDGARLFEATTGYYDDNDDDGEGRGGVLLRELVAPFDSIYISLYKGLGGMTGAMLLGSQDFCDQARIWLRRFGGNVYTILPYAVSGWAGYRRQWCQESDTTTTTTTNNNNSNDDDDNTHPDRHPKILSFLEKKRKLVGLVKTLSNDDRISQVLTFDPAVPQTNLVHGYLWANVDTCHAILDEVESKHGIRVLIRVRPVSTEQAPGAYHRGYRSYFEWTMGEANGQIPDDIFLRGWKEFAKALLKNHPESLIK